MPEIPIPLFSVSSSLKQGGVFTVERAGAAKKSGRVKGPVSLCDIAKEHGLKQLHIVASNWVDFMVAHKNLKEIGCQLVFGLKLVVCENLADKTDASLKTESKIIIWMNGGGAADYQALINIFSVAANDGFYYTPRIDWKTLCAMWHKDLILSLPFYSSFLARNTLTFAAIVPQFPEGVKPVLLQEIGQELATDQLIEPVVARYAETQGLEVQPVKSIYYKKRDDAKQFQVWRCVLSRTTFDKPNDSHSSREFSWDSYQEIVASLPTTQPTSIT
jgi:DNA polymerase III alpha subunit